MVDLTTPFKIQWALKWDPESTKWRQCWSNSNKLKLPKANLKLTRETPKQRETPSGLDLRFINVLHFGCYVCTFQS